MAIKLLVLDWDGMLFDTDEARHQASCHVYKMAGLKPPSFDDFLLNEDGLSLEQHNKLGFSKVSQAQTREWFFSVYDTNECRLFPEVFLTLADLIDLECELKILSSHPTEDIKRVLGKFRAAGRFTEVRGGVSDKASALGEIVGQSGLRSSEVATAGDLPADIRAGKEAQVVTIGYIGTRVVR
ncbi:MAG: HAD hydrolase-like protein, partial [bacterium]